MAGQSAGHVAQLNFDVGNQSEVEGAQREQAGYVRWLWGQQQAPVSGQRCLRGRTQEGCSQTWPFCSKELQGHSLHLLE